MICNYIYRPLIMKLRLFHPFFLVYIVHWSYCSLIYHGTNISKIVVLLISGIETLGERLWRWEPELRLARGSMGRRFEETHPSDVNDCWLVVWLPCFIFPYIGLLIIPTDFHIFQRGGPTTNQIDLLDSNRTENQETSVNCLECRRIAWLKEIVIGRSRNGSMIPNLVEMRSLAEWRTKMVKCHWFSWCSLQAFP